MVDRRVVRVNQRFQTFICYYRLLLHRLIVYLPSSYELLLLLLHMRVTSFKNLPTSTLSFFHLQSPLFMKQHQYLRKLRTIKLFRVVETSRQNRVLLTSRYYIHVYSRIYLFISTEFPSSVSLTSIVFFSPKSGALKIQNSIEMLKYLFSHQLFPKLILGTFITFIYSH